MKNSVLLRRIIALPLAAVLLSGILTAVFYILISQWAYAEIRANELVPVARAAAGMLEGEIPGETDLPDMLDRENKLFGASLYVYDINGEALIKPPEDKPKEIKDTGRVLDGDNGRKDHMDLTPEETFLLISEDWPDILSGAEITETRAYLGQPYLIAGVPIQSSGAASGVVILVCPLREINDTMRELNIVLLISTIAAFIIMLVPAWIAARRLVIPIRRMREVALAMALGDFSIRADETERGEIGELGRAMNHFAAESERLEKTRRDYVANVSHELRTPIASIRAIGETLRDGMAKTEEKKTRFYNNIVRESMRLSRLVDDLLELSRLQSGTEGMQKICFDLRDTLENVTDFYAHLTNGPEVLFTLEVDMSEPIYVNSNPDRVEQTLVILLDNAVKHTPGGGEIKLGAFMSDGKIKVSVENTGEAVSSEDLPFLFERFYKVDKSHSGGGTGLGLSIAREIMKGLGESICAEDTGNGMKFIFTLGV
ncbi:MAG: HAMP domain-containing histidine kinase [Clostridiales bacterium]|jgi:signal transduction histidine kinase|nr:HAMP domain-containing histidine kinase [Clostridiales bacterium]